MHFVLLLSSAVGGGKHLNGNGPASPFQFASECVLGHGYVSQVFFHL
jgi:hypothetical protein